MQQPDPSPIIPTVRHDGWTAARKVQALEYLAGHGNVRAACARVAFAIEAAEAIARMDRDEDPDDGEGLSPVECYTAGVEAAAQWDAGRDAAHAAVDRLLWEPVRGAGAFVRTVSNESTSPLAEPLAGRQPEAGT